MGSGRAHSPERLHRCAESFRLLRCTLGGLQLPRVRTQYHRIPPETRLRARRLQNAAVDTSMQYPTQIASDMSWRCELPTVRHSPMPEGLPQWKTRVFHGPSREIAVTALLRQALTAATHSWL